MENRDPLTFVHISDTHIYEDDHTVFEWCPQPPTQRARLLVDYLSAALLERRSDFIGK